MRQYYIEKLIKYATEGKIEIKVKSLGCVDSFIYKMYVKDISNETIQSFSISSEDIKMLGLISRIENIKNIIFE